MTSWISITIYLKEANFWYNLKIENKYFVFGLIAKFYTLYYNLIYGTRIKLNRGPVDHDHQNWAWASKKMYSVDQLVTEILNISSAKSIRLFRIMSIPTTFRLFRVLTSEPLGRRLPVFTLLLWQRQHFIVVDALDYKLNCNMETPWKRLNKYWCSVPQYMSDIKNI